MAAPICRALLVIRLTTPVFHIYFSCTPIYQPAGRRGDAYVQGVLEVVGAENGQVRVRDVVAGSVFNVSFDRLDRRVNDPRYRIIGDSRTTLEAKIEAKDSAMETMRVDSERAVGDLRAEIAQLRADTTAQVLKPSLLIATYRASLLAFHSVRTHYPNFHLYYFC